MTTTLDPEATGWRQINIEFADPAIAESTAAQRFLSALQRAHTDGIIESWWFLRKPPGWRLRLLVPSGNLPIELLDALTDACTANQVTRWWESPYEPETTAFGGGAGIRLAHDLFTADSIGIAALLTAPSVGSGPDRLLLSMLLMSHLHRAAGLDWNERGDVWARVAAQRPAPTLTPDDAEAVTAKARTVLTTDTRALTAPGSALHHIGAWADGLDHVGQRLADAAGAGRLDRGIRAILALHVLFHWNRLGIAADRQSVWATAARDAVLGDH